MSYLCPSSCETKRESDLEIIGDCTCSRVLIIDDNGFNIFSLKLLLEDYIKVEDSQFDEAYNGKMALDLIEEKVKKCCNRSYKLIFVDQNMPIMDGITMMKLIRKK